LNDVFHPAGVKWDVSLTHAAGDATRLAAEVARSGVDLVAAYGGDGTQMEVANGLLGTGIPQAILPGGTGNAMAHDLNIPLTLREAAGLLVTSQGRRAIDLVRSGDKVFMLRAYTGLSSDQAASREEKDRLGQLAYIQASLKFLREAKAVAYRVTLDGVITEINAIICFILNAGSIGGVMGLDLPAVGDVSVSDGYLDFYAVTKEVQPLRAISHHVLKVSDTSGGVYHWRAKEILLDAASPQEVWIDGEMGGSTPFNVSVISQALEVVVPDLYTDKPLPPPGVAEMAKAIRKDDSSKTEKDQPK